MNTSKTSPILSLGLLFGLLSGCAHAGGAAVDAADSPAGEASRTVTAADIPRTPEQPIEKALMARVPGVWISRTADGGIAVRLRGATSIHGSNAPLYVVNGIVIEPGPNGGLTGIDPYDIATIEVLKDAASTTMYGVRGANGVIVIKTKGPGQ